MTHAHNHPITPSTAPRAKGEPLVYLGREMNLKPINMTWSELIDRLHDGLTTRVILEPGDATRYEFFVAPLDVDTRSELRLSGGVAWYLFAGFGDGAVQGVAMVPTGAARPHHFEALSRNLWTREVLVAFDEMIARFA